MAQFKLYLLNLRANENEFAPRYIHIPISEFDNTYNIHQDNTKETSKFFSASLKTDENFCYTYNEKFKISQNTQRTLSFSMNKNIIRVDRVEKNPFINYLFIGTQLLLIDKYDNHHLMTIGKIDYDFKELNTVFNYECSDSFNYQLSRQNDGYEITNESDNLDFIGARDIDWWVKCKISPECKISYKYLQLDQSLIINNHVVKSKYNRTEHAEFYKTVPFSGSGTANSVLIALGELYGLQLRVYERFDYTTGQIEKYFWFEPSKSLKPTGLKYSPYSDLQSFKLSHDGQSFSSVLNIQSNTIGDEIITVLPSVPNFFRQWFETSEWNESSFIPGLFSSACQETVEIYKYNDIIINSWYKSEEEMLYIPLGSLTPDLKYDQVKFTTQSKQYSNFTIINGDADTKPQSYSSKYDNWKLKITFSGIEDKEEKWKCFITANEDIIPHKIFNELSLQQTIANIELCIPCKLDTGFDAILSGTLYYVLFRTPSSEEIEFATIADQLPWLENKLINFEYFKDHSIINNSEYQSLMQILENNLRKTNAKLLLYSQLYYQAIQNKTKILANLSSKIDLVGATFQADFINPFMSQGKITKTTDFELALSDLFSNSTEPTNLITYYETLTDYVNKYINAEQTFLKNMYLFREYFESYTNFGTLHEYWFTLPKPKDDDNIVISFSSPNKLLALVDNIDEYYSFKLVEKNTSYQPMFHKQEDTYIPIDKNKIITEDNYNQGYYYLDGDNKRSIDSTWKQNRYYSKDQTYYEKQWEVQDQDLYNLISKSDAKQIVCDNGEDQSLKFLCTINNNKVVIQCWQHCIHTTKCPTKLTYEGNIYPIEQPNTIYVKVNYAEMRNNYIYRTLQYKNTDLYNAKVYTKVKIPMQSTSNWLNDFADTYLSPETLKLLADAKQWDEDLFNNKNLNKVASTIYKKYWPQTKYYWYGKANDNSEKEEFHAVSFVNGENYMSFNRKIAVSSKSRSGWRIAAGVVSAGNIHLGAIFNGILSLCWKNGLKGFGSEGWTYHDIFNCDYAPAFQGWTDSTRLMYVTNEDAYKETNQREVFKSDCFKNKETWLNDKGTSCVYLEDEDKDTHEIISEKWTYNEAKNILLTYFSLQKRFKTTNPYYYKTSYWRVLEKDEIITNNDSFLMLPQPYSDDQTDVGEYFDLLSLISSTENMALDTVELNGTLHYRLDSTILYPLQNLLYDVNGSDFVWSNNQQQATLESLITNTTSLLADNTWIWSGDVNINNELHTGQVIFLREENFDYEELSTRKWGETINYDDLFEYSTRKYYLCESKQEVNLLKDVTDFTIGFYITGTEDSDYISTNQLTSFSDDLEYYEKVQNEFQRRYTLQQLIDRGDVYIKPGDSYSYQTFSDDLKEINIQYNKYQKISSNSIQAGFTYELVSTEEGKLEKHNDGIWYLVGNDISIPLDRENNSELVQYKPTALSEMTYGDFWYKYRNDKSTSLMEKAMLIETNLTEYWTNAYYASKNCRFFLPEHWQPTVDQKKNYFHSSILHRPQTTNIILPIYVPYVSKQIHQDWYQFKHVNIAESVNDIIMTTNNLSFNESTLVSYIENDATALKQIFEYLNLSSKQWLCTKTQESYVLYKHESGGTTWQAALKTFGNNSLSSDLFGGWYDMMIKVLQTCNYVDYNPQQYYQAQKEHDAIWTMIYTKYPNLIYEKSFTSEDATTSQELLQLAQYAFRDYNQPESNYNISVIDLNTLKGYKGQELKIGDGIEVNASEIYDDNDSDIYRSLIQYLYITDISYDLRKDDDIQLTVNSIKYQDKVIGQLIKLIR